MLRCYEPETAEAAVYLRDDEVIGRRTVRLVRGSRRRLDMSVGLLSEGVPEIR